MKNFRDKVAIVTGAGSGIGRELALELARAGARLAVTDRYQERIDQVVGEIKGLGAEGRGYPVDHSNFSMVGDFAKRFFSDFGSVDILCLNAGVGTGGRIEEYDIKDWEWTLGNNLWSAVYMVHVFVPRMIAQGSGQILITASGAGLVGIPGMAPYCTSKFALVGLGEVLRCELAKHHITVSVLCPGIINTKIIQDGQIYMKDQSEQSQKTKIEDFYRRYGTDPKKVARDGLRALSRNRGIQLSPFNVWPLWLVKRLSPSLYQYLAGVIWEKNLLI